LQAGSCSVCSCLHLGFRLCFSLLLRSSIAKS
jgi:hypothetical protein